MIESSLVMTLFTSVKERTRGLVSVDGPAYHIAPRRLQDNLFEY